MSKCKVTVLIVMSLSVLNLSCLAGEAQDEKWTSCRKENDCVIVHGGGGWPEAISKKYVKEHDEWLRKVSPYTEFYLISDCLSSENEIKAYWEASKQNVACQENSCRITVKAHCTRFGAEPL